MRTAPLLMAVVLCITQLVYVFAGEQATATEQWRKSWPDFVNAVDDFRKQAKPDEFPQTSLSGMARGQVVPDTWAVMKRFNGEVVFEGTFQGTTTDSLMEGMTKKLNFKMPETRNSVTLHAYPSASSIATWEAVAPGTVVRFRANLQGVSGASFPGLESALADGVLYIVLLQEVEPVK